MAVSAVLNGTGRNVKVSPEKADHIRQVARDLRYQPNTLARSLRSRQTNMVAVVFQHIERLGEERPYYPQLLNGVMAALFPADYTLCLCPKLNQGSDAQFVSDGRFDGVLWCRPDFTEASLKHIQNSAVPIVMLHAPPGSVAGVPTLCADNESAMRAVIAHLTELGHERIAFIIDPITAPTVEGRARVRAFQVAAERMEAVTDVFVWEHRADEVAAYKSPSAPHTALVCFSDAVAGQVLLACQRHGISVPGDISVVGFDSSSFCEGTKPRLTSVNQPVEEMAFAATRHLLDLIRNANEGKAATPTVSTVYDCGLDVRESTGPIQSHRRAII